MTKTVEILTTFEGYPDGDDKPSRMYLAGAKVDVPDYFADLVVAKELAREIGGAEPRKPEASNEPGVEPGEQETRR